MDGSAKIALEVEPSFEKFIFVEKDPKRCRELEKIQKEHPKKDKIIIRNLEANEYLLKLCQSNWTKHRAVLFLDPFGLQVKWDTLKAIARTKAFDVWILFPLGSGVSRLLRKDGQIHPNHKKILDNLFGSSDWFDEFYKFEAEPDLFGEHSVSVRKIDLNGIGEYFAKRLKEIFPGVAHPLPLRNSRNNPIFLFCFAAGNPNAEKHAVKIANDIIFKELKKD